jgi:hypothetical protein
VFSICTQFGLPTGLLTVTPDDADNYKMFVYKNEAVRHVSTMHSSDYDSVRKYLSQCETIRVDYPGFAELEFEIAMDIVITDVFGWNREGGYSNVDGGLFGKLHSWFFAVEEQGRKTLHGHFLIWVEGWDEMIVNLVQHEEEEEQEPSNQHQSSVENVMEFMKNNVSTSCFDINVHSRLSDQTRMSKTMAEIALEHECVDNDPTYEYCTDQQLRNMRYRHCRNDPEELQLAKCLKELIHLYQWSIGASLYKGKALIGSS